MLKFLSSHLTLLPLNRTPPLISSSFRGPTLNHPLFYFPSWLSTCSQRRHAKIEMADLLETGEQTSIFLYFSIREKASPFGKLQWAKEE